MNKIEELEKLLKTEVLIQVNEEIITIKKLIGKDILKIQHETLNSEKEISFRDRIRLYS